MIRNRINPWKANVTFLSHMSHTPASLRTLEVSSKIDKSIDKYDSTYFVPNYPFNEPLFYIPRMPNIIKVPGPQAPRKPPPPGYDMRTLRRQLEFLTIEIEEKEATQQQLYQQNEQLWSYIQDLLDANNANTHLMRDEILKLHEELKTVHKERFSIAEKLQLALNSKEMLAQVNRDLQDTHASVEEIERRKREAEKELIQARTENSHLEKALQSQVERLQGVHTELDEYRKRKLEDDTLDIADNFFYSNRTILRAAYYRFRTGEIILFYEVVSKH